MKQLIIDLEQIRLKIESERDKIENQYSLEQNVDARVRTLNSFNNLLRSYVLGLLLDNNYVSNITWLSSIISPRSPLDAIKVNEVFLTYLKNGYIYSFTQITESYLRAIVRSIQPGNKGNNEINKVFNTVKQNLCLKNKNGEYAFYLLFAVRNCIHNNGAYFGRDGIDYKISYRNKEYLFEQQKIHSYADLDLLKSITEDILDLMIEIIHTEKVKNISTIKDFTV